SQTHDELGPPEVSRPLILGADSNRGDAGCLEFFNASEEAFPGLHAFRGHAGLLEQGLVVPEHNFGDVTSNAVEVAIGCGEGGNTGGADIFLGRIAADILNRAQDAGSSLLIEYA